MKLYRFFYKSIFIAFYHTWSRDLPHYNAVLFYSLSIFLNVAFTLPFAMVLKGLGDQVNGECEVIRENAGWLGVLAILLLIVVNYLLFIRSGDYKRMAKDFDQASPSEKRKCYAISVTITIIGYVSPIMMIIFRVFLRE